VLTRGLPDTGTVRRVRDHNSVSAGLVIFGVVGGALVPWNAEDAGGSAMLHIRAQPGSRLADGGTEQKFFTPERVWHWPDLADPGTLAGYVRQAIASAAFGGEPPETR